MIQKKKIHPIEKYNLHIRNKHRTRYDFKQLCSCLPALEPFVIINKFNDSSIDFANPDAVKMLNKALLKFHYQIDFWDIPNNYLCPPIPGRADYIHNIADLLASGNAGKIPTGYKIKCLDIGIGANCIYPIIGHQEYGWSFVGSDIHQTSIEAAKQTIALNSCLQGFIELRLQSNSKAIFKSIIQPKERFHVTICNPPFHNSIEEAHAGTLRKLNNLSHLKIAKPVLNFGGDTHELSYNGGELGFVKQMIHESIEYKTSCLWFSTLISKKANLQIVYDTLKQAKTFEIKTFPMGQGNKISRIVAWTFLNKAQQIEWNQIDI
ncbi:MAG: 23S rRNA (adenine(1618)-N(6))-methyltransferase RlmF [Saprospiraceae bacterium]